MQVRALEHVAFLHGRGFTKEEARLRVAEAMDQSDAALRNWASVLRLDTGTSDYLDDALETAKQAGRLIREGAQVTSSELTEFLESVEAEPLERFGQRYRAHFPRSNGHGK